MSFPTNAQSDEATWPDQQKDKDNENDKDMRTLKDNHMRLYKDNDCENDNSNV